MLYSNKLRLKLCGLLKYYITVTSAWSSLVVGDDGCIGPSGKLMCL